MGSVADTPDWSAPGGTPAQLIGHVVGPTGTVLCGTDGTDARAILVDSSGRLIINGAGYKSLTGPGATATPGELDQAGAFTVTTDPTDSVGITLFDGGSGGITLDAFGTNGIVLNNANAAGIYISDTGAGGVLIAESADGGVTLTDAGTGGIKLEANGLGQIELRGQVTIDSATVNGTPLSIISAVSGQNVHIALSHLTAQVTIQAGQQVVITGGDVTLAAGATGNSVNLDGANGGIINVGKHTTDRVGFYGKGPASQHTHPSTLADVIAILTNVGLCA